MGRDFQLGVCPGAGDREDQAEQSHPIWADFPDRYELTVPGPVHVPNDPTAAVLFHPIILLRAVRERLFRWFTQAPQTPDRRVLDVRGRRRQ
jgi:hypothetical protein